MNPASVVAEPASQLIAPARIPVLVSYCQADDDAAEGALTAFLADVVEEYEASFGERLELITEREAPPWGQRDPWGEALRAGAPLVAMVSPIFSADADRVAEAVGLSGGGPDDPTGRVVLLPWERIEEPVEEAIPTISRIPPNTESYADAVRGVTYWVRGVIDYLTEHRPAEVELTRGETPHAPGHPLGQELAFQARQYSRLSAQILRNADILDGVTIAIFEGFERVLGSQWLVLEVPGACDLAAELEPHVANSKAVSRTMLRSWKEARRILRHMHAMAEDADYHPYRERLKAMLRDLAEALDVRVDVQTLTELQFGADARGDLRPAFRALLRNAHSRQRVRAGVLSCLGAVGDQIPDPIDFLGSEEVRPQRKHAKKSGAERAGSGSEVRQTAGTA
ncbi:MAG: hypothetical protein LBJ08_05415 [Bifidobacteriaceae bacterium]|nr:hypothetical protein [Bifidobacteriaceae bacterium]